MSKKQLKLILISEAVIDFTKLFMNLWIFTLFKAPKDPETEIFCWVHKSMYTVNKNLEFFTENMGKLRHGPIVKNQVHLRFISGHKIVES